MINISKPQIGEDEKAAVMQVLDSGQLAQGPRVKEFENQFAAWLMMGSRAYSMKSILG
jgi:dTDP-4-amino-4,6-dideoxygalactose transaminase